MSLPFDRVVLSADRVFAQFTPLVVRAWKRLYGEDFPVVVGFVDESTKPGYPVPNIAKIARYQLAGQFPDDVCLIHDMDTVPLDRDYYIRLTSPREPGRLLCVGAEVYRGTPHEGKFPAATLCGEGKLFRQLFSEPWTRFMFDRKEFLGAPPDAFSDESLLRALLAMHPEIRTQHVERGINIYTQWIDRSWWSRFDPGKLAAGKYYEANLPRPAAENWDLIKPIADHIFGKDVSKEEALWLQ